VCVIITRFFQNVVELESWKAIPVVDYLWWNSVSPFSWRIIMSDQDEVTFCCQYLALKCNDRPRRRRIALLRPAGNWISMC